MVMVAKKHYSVPEIYRITHLAARTTAVGARTRCDRQSAERIMLAVTEVNGCELCSYAHTRLALDAGVSDAQVRALLGGVTTGVPDDQLPGIAFAQHYAHTRGHPDPTAWTTLVDQFGTSQAFCVLRAIWMMMWGNALGIPLSSLRSRLQGSPDPGSSLAYEIGTPLGSLLVTPVALVHAALRGVRGGPIEP
ncbi:MAG: carboxymuconolactone decarboxylase family protein [Candidatus Nanopelagicales bacterium]